MNANPVPCDPGEALCYLSELNLPESARHWGVAMHEYNRALRARSDLHTLWLPLGDGVAVSIKR